MSSVNENQTTWLTLVGFGKLQHLGFLPFAFFLAIYVATVGGNILIVLAVASSRTLHTPMYFFLCHFSLLEIGYTSNIVPRLLQSFLEGGDVISLVSCLAQFYVFASLAAAECLMLSAMSYDRYLAICHPLHYPVLMSTWCCGCLATGAWFSGFFFSAFTLALAAPLSLCPGRRVIDHYFCDFAPVVGLFCGEVWVMWGGWREHLGLPHARPLPVDCCFLRLHPEGCAENTLGPREAESLLHLLLPPQCGCCVLRHPHCGLRGPDRPHAPLAPEGLLRPLHSAHTHAQPRHLQSQESRGKMGSA